MESYAFYMKQIVEKYTVKDKINDGERKQICEAYDEDIKWPDGIHLAELSHKELEKVCTTHTWPILEQPDMVPI